jgi:hypothetical protein
MHNASHRKDHELAFKGSSIVYSGKAEDTLAAILRAQYGRLFTVAGAGARPYGLFLIASCTCPSLEIASLPYIGISSVLEDSALWLTHSCQ